MSTWWTLTYEFELDNDDENEAMEYVKAHYDEPTSMTSESEDDE